MFTLQKRVEGDRFAFTAASADSPQSAAPSAVSDFIPTPGVWYRLAGVYDAAGHQIRLYANGTLLASASATLWNANAPTEIGCAKTKNGLPADFADGAIDEVQFTQRALTSAQISASYHTQLNRFQPNTFTWANPIYFQGNGPGADIHDPDIIRDNGVYYCVATLAPFRNYTDRDPKLPDLGSSPGIALYASLDLKVWKFQNWLSIDPVNFDADSRVEVTPTEGPQSVSLTAKMGQ